MTEAQHNLFLSIGAWTCAVASLLNLLNLKRRGNSALVLSAAFLTFGAILWMIKTHAAQVLISVAGFVFVGLLVADVVIRSRRQEHPQ